MGRKMLAVKRKNVQPNEEEVAAAKVQSEGFLSEHARKHYGFLKASSFIFERGFVFNERCWTNGLIEAQKWQVLCHHRTEYAPEIVREFYANARFSSEGESWVRGKKILYTAEAINDFLVCDPEGVDEFSDINEKIDEEDFAKALTISGQFEYQGPKKTIIDSSCLNRGAKTWVLFVTASMIPTKHLSGISLEKAHLIYCILRKLRVNAGRIISQQLYGRIRAEKGSYLWFPTLITGLCKSMGVAFGDEVLGAKVGRPITEVVIEKNIKEVGESSKKKKEQDTPVSDKLPKEAEHVYSKIMSSVNHIKEYQRQEHLRIDSELKYQRACLEALMKESKLKLPRMGRKSSRERFDSEGFLVDEEGKRCDPAEESSSSSEDE